MPCLLRLLLCCLALSAAAPELANAADFGVARVGDRFVVDSGAELQFSVDARTGDVVSLRYRGIELQSPEPKRSQIASGLGSARVAARTVGDTIVVSASAGDLVQYYMARKGRDAIYLATYAPTLPAVGELRFIARLDAARLPDAEREPDSSVGTAIEGKDVFLLPDGRTSSKFYSARRALDDAVHGVSGPGLAVRMWMGDREHGSGGPFFKDIATQKTARTHELYDYMFSNHTQTEPYRGGLHGVYVLQFSRGGADAQAPPDLRFVDASLGLQGFLGAAERGAVAGQVFGIAGGQPAVVALRNAQAQYWTRVDADGRFRIAGLRPGAYRIALYRNELEVAHATVQIAAAATAQADLHALPLPGQVIWQIGDPDGTPAGFRNAALLASAHPSDRRMAPWGPLTYRVGRDGLDAFPAAQWRGVNTPTRIAFMLGGDQVHAYRLRLFVTLTQAGGRPQLRVNDRWSGPVPPRPQQPDSRGITRGTYRGNNTAYLFDIPASALQAGLNTLDIGVASGTPDNGFLGPGLVFDSVQLLAPQAPP